MKKSTPQCSALHDHLGFWLRHVSNHVSARFEKQLEAEGVSVIEWVALRTLMDHPQATPATLIEGLGITKGAASKVVSRLEAKGLAHRSLAPGSGREQTLTLSEQGRALLPRLAAVADANDAHFFGHLRQAQRLALHTALQALARHHGLTRLPTE